LSGWEQQCADSVDEQPDYEQSLRDESENSHTRIWTAFQDSAAAIAQLYRDRVTGEPATLWLQFQTAAGTVTSLYKGTKVAAPSDFFLSRQSFRIFGRAAEVERLGQTERIPKAEQGNTQLGQEKTALDLQGGPAGLPLGKTSTQAQPPPVPPPHPPQDPHVSAT
jgi:hypothetical protein